MNRIGRTLACWVVLTVSRVAGPPAGAQQATASPATGDTVTVKLFQFNPDTVRTRAGKSVHWLNGDEITHTVTSGVDGRADGRFRVVLPAVGATAFVTPRVPGTYRYFCERHPHMTGTVTVTH